MQSVREPSRRQWQIHFTIRQRYSRPTFREDIMKAFVSMLLLPWSLAAGPTFAQAYPPNEAGGTMGHWHLNSQQGEANKKLFVALGGAPARPSAFSNCL